MNKEPKNKGGEDRIVLQSGLVPAWLMCYKYKSLRQNHNKSNMDVRCMTAQLFPLSVIK